MIPKEDMRLLRISQGLVAVALLAGGIWLGFRYALPVLLPFLLARLTAVGLRPLVDLVAGKRRMLRRVTAAVLVILSVGLLLLLVVKGAERGVRELGRLLEGFTENHSGLDGLFDSIFACVTSISSHFPFLDHPQFDAFCAALDEAVARAVGKTLEGLSGQIPAAALTVAGRLPTLLLFLTTWLLSCYDFCASAVSPEERLIACLPPIWREKCEIWRQRLGKALGGYLRAYVMLSLLTFGEMLLALSALRVPYAFLLAAVIALLDFLPVLGAGTVLLPWALGCFLLGRGGMGTALLVILGIHTILRQILEPHLVGRELGLSPFASLAAVYTGFRLLGVWGMILSPLAVMVIREILCRDSEKTPSGA